MKFDKLFKLKKPKLTVFYKKFLKLFAKVGCLKIHKRVARYSNVTLP